MPKDNAKYGTEAVSPGDSVMEEGGSNFVNQTKRNVVEYRYVNSNKRKEIRNHIYRREVGMTLSSFVDGKLMEIGCKGDVKSKRYIGFFKIFKRADRVHVIGVSEHDHTIVSPVFVRIDRAVPVEGTVSLTVRLRVTSEENLSFYENMLNSSYVSHDHNYHYNESAIIMTDSDLERFWRHSLQNSIREPMSDQRLVFRNIGVLKQRFINYLTHDPIFQHFEIVSADIRFGINEWEEIDHYGGEKEREVKNVSIDSDAKVAKIRISREEYGAMRGDNNGSVHGC